MNTHKQHDLADERTGKRRDSESPRAPIAPDLEELVARLDNLGEIFRVQGEILATGPATVPALAAFLARRPSVFPQPRVAAAECLGIIGGEQALAALLAEVERDHTAITDPVTALAEESVRNAAARQLARFDDPRVVPVLLQNTSI